MNNAPPSKKRKRSAFDDLSAKAPQPSLGTTEYSIESSKDWTELHRDSYHADERPATSLVDVRYSTPTSPDEHFRFGISHRENPKGSRAQVKLNPFMVGTPYADIYYSKHHDKFTPGGKRKKIALDDVANTEEQAYAKDILRVMKGAAYDKGLESDQAKRAVLAGSLLSTSERGRNPFNPINAHIELYKVKHGRQSIEDAFHVKTGTIIAAREGGADASRKTVDTDFLDSTISDKAMRAIYDERVADPMGDKHAKHGKKSFKDWVAYKSNKWAALYPPGDGGTATKRTKKTELFKDLPETAPRPTLGTTSHAIESSSDWTDLHKDTYHADQRPAMSSVDVHYKTPTLPDAHFEFGISHRENPKQKRSQVKLNPFMVGTKYDDIYYSHHHEKYKPGGRRKKIALDLVPQTEEAAYAKDILRVMKGAAFTKGLQSTQTERVLIASSLLSTSERGRNPYNPINAQIELYKVKHGQQTIENAFHVKTGSVIAAREGGADLSRKLVDTAFLNQSIGDSAMRKIYDTRIKNPFSPKFAKHGNKSFEEWTTYKAQKWLKRFPADK